MITKCLTPKAGKPYLPLKNLKEYLENYCDIDCQGVVAKTILDDEILNNISIDECCKDIFVRRGTSELLISTDYGNVGTWSSIGARLSSFTQNFASGVIAIAPGESLIPFTTSATITSDDTNFSINNTHNSIDLLDPGHYIISAFVRVQGTAANRNMNLRITNNNFNLSAVIEDFESSNSATVAGDMRLLCLACVTVNDNPSLFPSQVGFKIRMFLNQIQDVVSVDTSVRITKIGN